MTNLCRWVDCRSIPCFNHSIGSFESWFRADAKDKFRAPRETDIWPLASLSCRWSAYGISICYLLMCWKPRSAAAVADDFGFICWPPCTFAGGSSICLSWLAVHCWYFMWILLLCVDQPTVHLLVSLRSAHTPSIYLLTYCASADCQSICWYCPSIFWSCVDLLWNAIG